MRVGNKFKSAWTSFVQSFRRHEQSAVLKPHSDFKNANITILLHLSAVKSICRLQDTDYRLQPFRPLMMGYNLLYLAYLLYYGFFTRLSAVLCYGLSQRDNIDTPTEFDSDKHTIVCSADSSVCLPLHAL